LNSWVSNPATVTNSTCVAPNGTSVRAWVACADW
jgi:hypothetical protein